MKALEGFAGLAEARRWLVRARGQQATLRRRLQQHLAEPACRLDVGVAADGDETVYRFRPPADLPDDAPYLAQDAACSILRAMDAFYAAVTSTRFGSLPLRRGFPFARSEADLERMLRKGWRGSPGELTGAFAALIRNAEPYRDGDSWIAALPAICSVREGRLLELRAVGRLRVIGNGEPFRAPAAIQAPAWQRSEPALVLRMQDPQGQFAGRYRLTQQAVFTGPAGVAGCEVVSVLTYQIDVAQGLLDTLAFLGGSPDRRRTDGEAGHRPGDADPPQRPAQSLSG